RRGGRQRGLRWTPSVRPGGPSPEQPEARMEPTMWADMTSRRSAARRLFGGRRSTRTRAQGWAGGVGALALLAALASCGSPASVGPAPTSGSAQEGGSGAPTTGSVTNVSGPIAFPAGVSANHRYLVDQQGRPFLMVGDSPQCLSANLSTDDMDYFFADRQAHGFNTAWVNLLCGSYTRGAADASTYDGIKPFLKENDLSTPN